MSWSSLIGGFRNYLRLERGLSINSVEAYLSDVKKLEAFSKSALNEKKPPQITLPELELFITHLGELGISPKSQARMISSIKSFYKFLDIENLLTQNPSELLETPKIPQKIPVFLTIEEIDKIIASNDHSTPEGQRNRAIIEVLHGCGLRVSELIDLKISNLFLDIGFIKVIGKGNKERIVPINQSAIRQLTHYLEEIRPLVKIKPKCVDFVFLNRRGANLTRVMIFHIVKKLTALAEIDKNVSPHTFRHSFATHLYEGGADLRAIQDMLGHENITTTEIYSHTSTQYLRETLQKFHPRFNE